MSKKGFIGPIILIAALVLSYYLIVTNFSKVPNTKSRQLASNIHKYPNAKSWNVSNKAKICIYYFNNCKEAPAVITFSSEDKWASVYRFYRINLHDEGWSTRSRIVTSIPNSLVLGNGDYFENSICEAIIKERENNYLGLIDAEDTDLFTISVSCTAD